jgi:hypothetical protein
VVVKSFDFFCISLWSTVFVSLLLLYCSMYYPSFNLRLLKLFCKHRTGICVICYFKM